MGCDGDESRDGPRHARANVGAAGGGGNLLRSRSENGTSGTRARGGFGEHAGSLGMVSDLGGGRGEVVVTRTGSLAATATGAATPSWAVTRNSKGGPRELLERGEAPGRPRVLPVVPPASVVEGSVTGSFGIIGVGSAEAGKESGTPAKRRRKSGEGAAREGVVIPNE